MARNERAGHCWSQPPRSTPAKSRSGCSRGLGSEDLDDIGDIVNALSCGERKIPKSSSWQHSKSTASQGKYSSDCCLKNGLMQCRCLSQSSFPEWQRKSTTARTYTKDALPFERKSTLWADSNVSNGCFEENKVLEEFILDDNELCLLNYYDIPLNVSRRHVRNSGKVKTVSIIDTLSELASGATDREDEGGFSSAVSESAVLNRYLHKPKARHARQNVPRRDFGLNSGTFVPVSNATSAIQTNICNSVKNAVFSTPQKNRNDSFCNGYSTALDDSGMPCSSLKRTLKCLRKAVVSNVVEEENHGRKFAKEKTSNEEAFRLCFSDSEVKDTPINYTTKHHKLQLTPKIKSKSLLAVSEPVVKQAPKPISINRNRPKVSIPDWIQEVFTASKKGNVEKMKLSLRNIDPALVRNLSDDHGNNLWHICAVHNNFECLDWLCSHNPHHSEALKDENKNGFSPAALAVKHGSLLAVQWLIHNTISKAQLLPQSDSRSLLHISARYGQCTVLEWLLSYMKSQDLDAGIVDSEGNTALHLAAKYGHINCVKSVAFHVGNLKAKNESGLKPLDLAVKHGKNDCADFLAVLESCYNLASLNLRQHSDIQCLQKENTEMKNYFKELLTLTKRLQHRQKELVQSFTRMNFPPQYYSGSSEWMNEKNIRYLDDYSQLLATVMTDEEHRLLMVENKWKKSRKQTKHPDNRKKPLDVLRSQFNHIMGKVSSLSPPIPSTPETSDSSWNSDDEEIFQPDDTFSELSPPDVVNSLFPQTSVPYLDTRPKCQDQNSIDTNNKVIDQDIKHVSAQDTFSFKKPTPSSISSSNRDVNLRMFFKQNPNLRLSSETCSVLEVLEPSSSDGEECLIQKKKLANKFLTEKETEQSSSSSALETFGPYSRRPSSSGSKASGSQSSSSGGMRPNSFPTPLDSVPIDTSYTSMEKSKSSEETGNASSETGNKNSTNQLTEENNISSEPDLIKGTQKKKMLSPFSTLDRERKGIKDGSSDSFLIENPNISTDSESLEADRSFSSLVEGADALVSSQINTESSTISSTGKKKNFLFKFALKGRWQNKGSPRSLKNEISPEEFRETYSRSALADNASVPSQFVIPDNSTRKSFPQPKHDSEIVPVDLPDKDLTASCERLNDPTLFPLPPTCDKINQNNLLSRKGLLPARRDPPPAPPLTVDDDEHLQDHSDDDVSISIQKSSISSCVEGSSHNSYMNSRSPDLWHSTDSKSHFRPASSASRIDSPSRGDENFPLNKSSSASTEMLSALDSSTAGRQSPAPSEVSKTESALSPPSDVSKTESTRYLSQLGKIEESGHLTAIKITTLQSSEEQNIKDNSLTTDAKTPSKHKKSKKVNSDKPWYEFSDEEDVIIPQRYKAVTVSIRSSSEDEGAVTG